MSHDDHDALQGAVAGSFLQDMVNDSGMVPWIQDLGLHSHVPMFLSNSDDADGLQLDGGSGHDDMPGAARGKRIGDAVDSPAPSKRPARNLDYSEACHDAIQGMLHLDSEKECNVNKATSPHVKSRMSGMSAHAPASRNANTDNGINRFLTCVATAVPVEDYDQVPHSPAEPEGVPHTPSSSGPRRDKGLRSFSLKVCQKVEERDVTTYNEVADELVKEFKLDPAITFDEKNIRRRIYDALNVLMAMDIITRDKKNIRWKGFPQSMEKERELLLRRQSETQRELQRKYKEIEKKALQYISLRKVIQRNSHRPLPASLGTINVDSGKESGKEEDVERGGRGGRKEEGGVVMGGAAAGGKSSKKGGRSGSLKIPFVIVQTTRDNEIHLEWRNDKKEAMMTFDKSFELHDDVAVLNFMKMSQVENEHELRDLLARCPDVAALLLQRCPGIIRTKGGGEGACGGEESSGAGSASADIGGAGRSGGARVKSEPREGGSQ